MNKQAYYEKLQSTMLRYSDLINITVVANNEMLIPITKTEYLTTNIIDTNMRKYTGNDIYVRKSLNDKLQKAGRSLGAINPNLALEVVYGYRALSIQQNLFDKNKAILSKTYSGDELIEATHRLIAVPQIAGHPTGGAIDIQITKNGKALDFGTKIWDFSPDSYTFSPYINKDATNKRLLLRRVLTNEGFAPFDGEWWHFSYGDKEWAKYYNQPNAIYEQIEFSIFG